MSGIAHIVPMPDGAICVIPGHGDRPGVTLRPPKLDHVLHASDERLVVYGKERPQDHERFTAAIRQWADYIDQAVAEALKP